MERPLKNEGFREGDIIVTPVAHHYAIGRIKAEGGGTQEHLASERDRAVALALACKFAGAGHRMFVFKSPEDSTFALFDCKEILQRPATE
jgi:hypothetical protein